MKKKKEKKEVSTRNDYYNYEKIFMQLEEELNTCENNDELNAVKMKAEGFRKQDAPRELTEYLDISIKNKIISLQNKYNLDITKLRSFSKQF